MFVVPINHPITKQPNHVIVPWYRGAELGLVGFDMVEVGVGLLLGGEALGVVGCPGVVGVGFVGD